MISSRTLQKVCIISAKGIAWVLYAAFLEYCVHKVVKSFFRDIDPCGDNDVLFFTEKNKDCWDHVYEKKPCGANCSYIKMKKILGYMDRAKKRLDVCIYLVTAYDFAFAILDAHKRGVNVRVITDGDRMNGCGSQIQFLIEEGVPVRAFKGAFSMHHKFFIADGNTLVNSSLNWTKQGLAGNSEDVLICSEYAIVNKFLSHFNALWDLLG